MTLVGWSRDAEIDDEGNVSVVGAIKGCAPLDGTEQLILQVLRERKRDALWNTRADSEEDVFVYLSTATITEADLEAVFGPRWADVVRLVQAAAALTQQQFEALGYAFMSCGSSERVFGLVLDTWNSGSDLAATNAYGAARDASMSHVAVDEASMPVVPLGAQAAGWAAWAIARYEHLGTAGYTQELHDLLVAAWESVMGPLVEHELVSG